MSMDQREFHAGLRALLNIDQHEFDATIDPSDRDFYTAGNPRWAADQWREFQAKPHQYFIACCDSQAAKLWHHVQQRVGR